MRKLILAIIFILVPFTTDGQVSSSTCGLGVVIRPNGIVVIDGWTGYEPPINMPNPSTAPKPFNYPSQVALGSSVPNATKICVESDSGSQCKTVGEIRSFIRGTK